MKEVVIVSASRTPIGKFKGAFSNISAVALGTVAVRDALLKGNISPDKIGQVILGNVLQSGCGQNPARQVSIRTGIPETVPAMTINEVCGSGLKAIILGKQMIQVGAADTIVVGGMENMTQSPLLYPRNASEELQPNLLVDSMIVDGLTDAFSQKHMGVTAELVAEKYHITREEQDQFALHSQMKATEAQQKGFFDKEIAAVTLPDRTILTHDEGIRPNSSLEKLSTLRTAFKENGTVTAGNSSTLNDGASALVLMDKEVADQNGITYLATMEDYEEIGNHPSYMGYAPYYAIKNLLNKMAFTEKDIDLFEINEAFASQSISVSRDLHLPEEKVNIGGGAIALGHPIGASGARIVTTLLYALERENKQRGIASLCVGGGMGIALSVRRN